MGAALAIPSQSDILEPGALRRWLAQHRVTVAHLTPQLGQLAAAGGEGASDLPSMRRFFWGGDQLPPGLVRTLRAIAPGAEHVNFLRQHRNPAGRRLFPMPRPLAGGTFADRARLARF
jgi:non-ribosomal peptide synthetase component F